MQFGLALGTSYNDDQITKETSKSPLVYNAICHFLNVLGLTNVVTVRLSHGATKLRALRRAQSSVVVAWRPGGETNALEMNWDNSEVSLKGVLGDDAASYITLQAFRLEAADHIPDVADRLLDEPADPIISSISGARPAMDSPLPTIPEEGVPDETWLAEHWDLLNSTPEEQIEYAEELFLNVAVYSPQLDVSCHVNQYAHYAAAGVGVHTIHRIYATSEHDPKVVFPNWLKS